MNTQDVVQYMLSTVITRPECLHLAVDRGLGEGMKVEWWILAEMLAQLIQLRDQGNLDAVEGEHKYPIKKTARYEHCDLWWRVREKEHWLEVKTVTSDPGELDAVAKDLEKQSRLRAGDAFYHLTFVFPTNVSRIAYWRDQLRAIYQQQGLALTAEWTHPIWDERVLYAALFTRDNGEQTYARQ